NFDQLSLILKATDEVLSIVWAHLGTAHQIGYAESGEAAEPGHSKCPFLAASSPQAFDPLQDLEMAPANLPGDRLKHLPPAERLGCGRLANHKWLSPSRGGRHLQEDLGQPPTAGLNRIAVK